jgi:hypothetical protein
MLRLSLRAAEVVFNRLYVEQTGQLRPFPAKVSTSAVWKFGESDIPIARTLATRSAGGTGEL